MPEYDPFGRKIGEDPLDALRATTAPPPAVPAPVAPPRRARRPARAHSRRSGLVGWLVIAAFLVAALFGLGVVGTSVEGGIDGVTVGPAVDPAGPAAGIRGASLLRERNFAEAVDALSRAGRGRPLTMRVAPGRVDAALLDKSKVHHVRITPGGELDELATTAAPPAGNRKTIPYEKIDVSAPARLVKAGATRRNPARDIGYLVVTPGPPITWAAYFKGGRVVVGDAHGHLQRII